VSVVGERVSAAASARLCDEGITGAFPGMTDVGAPFLSPVSFGRSKETGSPVKGETNL